MIKFNWPYLHCVYWMCLLEEKDCKSHYGLPVFKCINIIQLIKRYEYLESVCGIICLKDISIMSVLLDWENIARSWCNTIVTCYNSFAPSPRYCDYLLNFVNTWGLYYCCKVWGRNCSKAIVLLWYMLYVNGCNVRSFLLLTCAFKYFL